MEHGHKLQGLSAWHAYMFCQEYAPAGKSWMNLQSASALTKSPSCVQADPNSRRRLLATTAAEVYVELDTNSNSAVSGVQTDLTNVISNGKLSVSPGCSTPCSRPSVQPGWLA